MYKYLEFEQRQNRIIATSLSINGRFKNTYAKMNEYLCWCWLLPFNLFVNEFLDTIGNESLHLNVAGSFQITVSMMQWYAVVLHVHMMICVVGNLLSGLYWIGAADDGRR